MSRVSHENPGGSNPNPAERWIEYNAKYGRFTYYDPDAEPDEDGKRNVVIPLEDMEFMFISQYHAVAGWHDTQDERIFSNEVYYIGTEELKVATKNGVIAEGFYKDFSAEVKAAGGKYIKAIYALMKDGTLARIQLKGSAVKAWGDLVHANKADLEKKWITVTSVESKKKGSIKWNDPVFEMGKNITKAQDAHAGEAAEKIQVFVDQKNAPKVKEAPEQAFVPVPDSDEDLGDDLPF
jgi:hypothetical protein